MAAKTARFQVDSRLARLLSQEYSSTEKALKELVDNAWDADAENVHISLPAPMTDAPIVISDDGSGMTRAELESHYLAIARDRRVHRGERTAGKQRLVKGRKGIGKFAGLMAAAEMTLETRTRGTLSRFTLRMADLAGVEDIEHLPIQIDTERSDPESHGTTITLRTLHGELAFPDAARMRQALIFEYGRSADFTVYVDGKLLGVDDVVGTYTDQTVDVSGVGPVQLRFAIAEERSAHRQAGIVLRVDGKVVGKPSFFGLEEREDFPQKLKSKLYGEVQADGLRDHVTAGWDSVIENSSLLSAVTEQVQPILIAAYRERYRREIQLAQARISRSIKDRLAAMPEHRREFADKAVRRALERFYGEEPTKLEQYVYVLLEAIEHVEYGAVLSHIHDASRKDVVAISAALDEFGMADMATLVTQAKARMQFLDELEALARAPETREAEMHKAIERNLWILGATYTFFRSNQTLKRTVEEALGRKYQGAKAAERPDLVLNEDLNGSCLLIEFKRPSHALNHEDYLQAISYRHELSKHMTKPIRVMLMGGRRSPDFPTMQREAEVEALAFFDVIASARRAIDWQLSAQH
ncbi:ATP-binding protein [Paucibacter sp. DJ2R-2]|uniref:ATP-binding protein n=1 Tax=Paucibacter sp. DJ2R-2 TaxID=2893558 RepID=UPI0021E4347B|nr:ATP-binding protein [Paucibacter sp. DJ2R-2]MCV2439256.1 ATP-binding protein [Paucibacter sp. DJ2R-2]